MRRKQTLLVALAALSAAGIGVAASVAIYGPAPLLSSPLGALLADYLPGGEARASLSPGDPVPSWRLPDIDGNAREVIVPGQATLINYWASWCAPCREELPLLADFSRRPEAGIRVVAIALDTATDAKAFLDAQPTALEVLVERPGARDSSVLLGNRHGVLPYSALVGADGRLIARKVGAFGSRAELRQWTGQVHPAP